MILKYKVTVPYLVVSHHIIEVDSLDAWNNGVEPKRLAEIKAESRAPESGEIEYITPIQHDTELIYSAQAKEIKCNIKDL